MRAAAERMRGALRPGRLGACEGARFPDFSPCADSYPRAHTLRDGLSFRPVALALPTFPRWQGHPLPARGPLYARSRTDPHCRRSVRFHFPWESKRELCRRKPVVKA